MEVLFHKYYHRLCHFAWLMVKDNNLVQDIVQDAFVSLWNNLDNIPEEEILYKNFLYTSIKNACLNILRHDKVIEKYTAHQTFNSYENDGQYILHNIMKAEIMVEIMRLVENLPQGCQNIFRMSYLEGMSNQKIAKELQLSVNTVKTQKQRGLKYLRKNISSEYLPLLLKIFLS